MGVEEYQRLMYSVFIRFRNIVIESRMNAEKPMRTVPTLRSLAVLRLLRLTGKKSVTFMLVSAALHNITASNDFVYSVCKSSTRPFS